MPFTVISRSAFLRFYLENNLRIGSRHFAATLILLLGFLVEVDGYGAEVLTSSHQCVQVLATLQDIVQVLVHYLFHLKQFFFDLHQFIGLVWVLPLLYEVSYIWVRKLTAAHVDDGVLVDGRVTSEVLSKVEE